MRQFLSRPATDEPLADQVRRFCERLERGGRCEDWQVRQAEQALRIYFVNFLNRAEWHRQPSSAVVDEQERTDPVPALQRLRAPVRTRHYSYRTECSYADWARRFLDYVAKQQGVVDAPGGGGTGGTAPSPPALSGPASRGQRIRPGGSLDA